MYSSHISPSLATRFARNTFVIRSETPLAEDQMRQAAPSIFAQGKHASRSERYSYIPTRAASAIARACSSIDLRAASSVRTRMCFTAWTFALSVRAATWASNAVN